LFTSLTTVFLTTMVVGTMGGGGVIVVITLVAGKRAESRPMQKLTIIATTSMRVNNTASSMLDSEGGIVKTLSIIQG
jgi:hypothetical protein